MRQTKFPPNLILTILTENETPPGNSITPSSLYKPAPLPSYTGPYFLPDVVDFLLQTLNFKTDFTVISTPQNIANCTFLAAAYSLFSGVEINEVIGLANLHTASFRDATPGVSHFSLLVEDLIFALQKSISKRIFTLSTFNFGQFRQLFSHDSGLISVVIPSRVFALPSPISEGSPLFQTWPITPQAVIQQLKGLGCTAIVRLNESLYNKVEFVRAGIHHYDLPFADGSNPPDEIVEKFFKICNKEDRVAVHCRVGLGRTGVMIGLLLMQKYQFTAREAIAWLRLVRPGAVLGGQQQYLCCQEGRNWNVFVEGNSVVRESQTSDERAPKVVVKRAAMSRVSRKTQSPIRSSQLIGLPNIKVSRK